MGTVPSVFHNVRYTHLPGWEIRCIAQEKGIYNAFPGGVQRLGDAIVAIYSSGAGHGNSHRQRWVKTTDRFQTFATGMFYEEATGAYDCSFLDDLICVGDTVNFKALFTVERTVLGYNLHITPSITTSGDTYALWGQAVPIGGCHYVTSYRTSGPYDRPLLLESADGMITWMPKVLLSALNTKKLNETAFVVRSSGEKWAISRDKSTPYRDLYISTCPSGLSPWSTPCLLPSHIKGTQPFALEHTNGRLYLFAGDRVGSTGVDAGGNHGTAEDITGISCWQHDGTGWSDTLNLAPSWSTDCGQAVPIELDDGKIGVVFYTSAAATNTSLGVEPGIYWVEFDPASAF